MKVYSKNNLIAYRISRSKQSIIESKAIAELGYWNTVANRLYYACFYSVLALHLKYNLQSTTHSGIKTQFHKHFIKSEILPVKFGKLYSDLFNKRQEADYEDFIYFKEKDILPLIEESEKFIAAI